MATDQAGETFEEFKNSFSYASRSDMNFKFLKSLSEQEAGDFFQDLIFGGYCVQMVFHRSGSGESYVQRFPLKQTAICLSG